MKRNGTKHLTTRKLAYKMQDMRKIVADRMKSKKLSAYAVAKATGLKAQTMSNFLSGAHNMRSDKLAKVFAAIGIEVRPKD